LAEDVPAGDLKKVFQHGSWSTYLVPGR
jgi:hypothetical protein